MIRTGDRVQLRPYLTLRLAQVEAALGQITVVASNTQLGLARRDIEIILHLVLEIPGCNRRRSGAVGRHFREI